MVVESAEAARERGIAPDLRGARRGHRQQRLPRHAARRRPHRRRDGERSSAQAEAPRRRPRRDRAARRCSSRTRPTRPRAAAAPPPRSTPCAASSATAADQIVVANTKGFTGHAMGVGIEDVVAIKALETGIVPPVPNFQRGRPRPRRAEPLQGRRVPGRATRCAWPRASARRSACCCCGWTPVADGRRRSPNELGYALPDRRPEAVWKTWLAPASAAHRDAAARGRQAPPARGRHAAPRRHRAAPPVASPTGAPHRARDAGAGGAPAPSPRAGRGRPSPRPRRRRRRAAARTSTAAILDDRRRADRLPRRHARPRPRPRSRPRHRHRQAGRDVRRHPRALRHRPRRRLKLRDYPTLRHVVAFVRRPHAAAPRPDRARRRKPAPEPAARARPPTT